MPTVFPPRSLCAEFAKSWRMSALNLSYIFYGRLCVEFGPVVCL